MDITILLTSIISVVLGGSSNQNKPNNTNLMDETDAYLTNYG